MTSWICCPVARVRHVPSPSSDAAALPLVVRLSAVPPAVAQRWRHRGNPVASLPPWLPVPRPATRPVGKWCPCRPCAKRQQKTKMADFPAVCNVETPVHGHNPVDSCLKVITPKSNQEKTWLSMFNFSALFLHLLCRCSLAQMVGLYKWVALRWGNMSFHVDRQKDSHAQGNHQSEGLLPKKLVSLWTNCNPSNPN